LANECRAKKTNAAKTKNPMPRSQAKLIALQIEFDKLALFTSFVYFPAGLPDFTWHNILKWGENIPNDKNTPNGHKNYKWPSGSERYPLGVKFSVRPSILLNSRVFTPGGE
jgi:hypothetical protein